MSLSMRLAAAPSGHVNTAAVAWAESAGIHVMHGQDGRVGLWQPPRWADGGGPDMSLADPLTNARAAVELSRDGTDWSGFPGCRRGIYRADGTML